jgi:hypothetical protein
MKLKAMANFQALDKKRGEMVSRKVGDIFELDPFDEAEAIFGILQSRGVCVDEAFIPARGEYRGLHYISFSEDGKMIHVFPGKNRQLSQEAASRLMTSGHVKPVDEGAWTPKKLLEGTLSDAPAKRMFDDPLPEKETWVSKAMRR